MSPEWAGGATGTVYKEKGQAQELRGTKWRKSEVILVLIQDPATSLTPTEDISGDTCVTRVTCVCTRVHLSLYV